MGTLIEIIGAIVGIIVCLSWFNLRWRLKRIREFVAKEKTKSFDLVPEKQYHEGRFTAFCEVIEFIDEL